LFHIFVAYFWADFGRQSVAYFWAVDGWQRGSWLSWKLVTRTKEQRGCPSLAH